MEAKEIRSLIIHAGFSFRKKRKSESDGEYQGNFDKAALRVYRMLTDLPNKDSGKIQTGEVCIEVSDQCIQTQNTESKTPQQDAGMKYQLPTKT